MEEDNDQNKILLPHHEQRTLCTTRLAYRQGRKLTAVKVYSISTESNHLLIFGVPSLNLRQETKALFIKFGKLIQFNISKAHACETFTQTYHAQYERIHSARLAKRMLDTKNFYGGSLHVCYAPELESVGETRQKLIQRHRDVVYRLNNLKKETIVDPPPVIPNIVKDIVKDTVKLNMGEVNIITVGKQVSKKQKFGKKADKSDAKRKNIAHYTIASEGITDNITVSNATASCIDTDRNVTPDNVTVGNVTVGNGTVGNVTVGNVTNDGNDETEAIVDRKVANNSNNIEIVDCTGVDNEVITNINESLNYNKFGNEIIKKLPPKPVNKIQFHFNKKL